MLEYQVNKFPLEEIIKTVNRLILTGKYLTIKSLGIMHFSFIPYSLSIGFSFGGVLAQMLAARLWLLPLYENSLPNAMESFIYFNTATFTDKLTSNLICITFGQPLIQSDLLTHVAEIFPDFKNNVHAIGSDHDSFSTIVEKVDCLTYTDDQQV